MFHNQGISTFPRARSLKELNSISFDEDTLSTPKAPYRRTHEIDDLKNALNHERFDRGSSNHDLLRRPGRKSRYDPRRNTTGLTQYEIRLNQTSKL